MDLDKGGTFTQRQRVYMGPSVGWVEVPAPVGTLLPVIAPGTYTIDPWIVLVTVNVAGAVTLILPKSLLPTYPVTAGAVPGQFAQRPVTIVDLGGFAAANPIAIQPFGSETIMSLPSIQLATNFGGYTLEPQNGIWTSISP